MTHSAPSSRSYEGSWGYLDGAEGRGVLMIPAKAEITARKPLINRASGSFDKVKIDTLYDSCDNRLNVAALDLSWLFVNNPKKTKGGTHQFISDFNYVMVSYLRIEYVR